MLPTPSGTVPDRWATPGSDWCVLPSHGDAHPENCSRCREPLDWQLMNEAWVDTLGILKRRYNISAVVAHDDEGAGPGGE